MPTTQTLHALGNQIVFADRAGDFSGSPPATAANSLLRGTPDYIQWDFGSVLATALQQSTKGLIIPIAAPEFPMSFSVDACIEHASAPTADDTVDFYWFPSPSATAGTGNGGGVSGADSAYTAGGLAQGFRIGSLILRNTVINIGHIGVLPMFDRYGSLVVLNGGDQAIATAADEIHVVFNPILPDGQPPALRITP